MSNRLLTHLYHRVNQAWILAFWTKPHETPTETLHNARHRLPLRSLFAVAEHLIAHAPPSEFGRFLSLVRTASKYLGLLLMQHPTPAQVDVYCHAVQGMMCEKCPNAPVEELGMAISEIARRIKTAMLRRRIYEPDMQLIESTLLPLSDADARWRAMVFNLYATGQPFITLMTGLRKMFRERYSFVKWVRVSRGFQREERRVDRMPDPEILGIQTNVDFQGEYEEHLLRPTGERVPLEKFCRGVGMECVAEGAKCSICVDDIAHEPQDHKGDWAPVITACGHYFHDTCLDEWVNDSGMRTANLCPECRAEMCEGRSRVPVELLDGMEDAGGEEEDEDLDEVEEDERYIMFMSLAEGINDALSGHVGVGY
jgi:hypothetical protein